MLIIFNVLIQKKKKVQRVSVGDKEDLSAVQTFVVGSDTNDAVGKTNLKLLSSIVYFFVFETFEER